MSIYQFLSDHLQIILLISLVLFFFFNDTATTEIYTLSLHDALPILPVGWAGSLAFAALGYHAVSLIVLGCTPSVWLLDTYLANRHPATHRATQPRFLRLLRGSRT